MASEADSSRKAIYAKAALFVIFMLVAGFLLVVFFVGGIIVPLVTRNYTLFVGGIFYFILFILVGTAAKKFEPAWQRFEDIKGFKRKTAREALKDNLTFAITVVLVLVFAIVFESYFLSFPSAITPRLGQEMLKSVLTIDGILIGFCGVVLTQFLWAIYSKGNTLYEQMIANRNKCEIIQELNEELGRLERVRLATIGAVFYSLMPLLASILICLNRLPMTEGTEPISPRTLLFDPILALIVGIVLLTITTLQTNLLPKTRAQALSKTN